MLQEFTLIGDNQCEVMVDINTTTGKIDGLYCYRDNVPVIEDYETGRVYKIHVKNGKNPLFVHIQSKARIFQLLIEKGGFIFSIDESDEDYESDIDIIQKALNAHKLSYNFL